MRKAIYGFLCLFLLASCSDRTGQDARTPNLDDAIVQDEYFVSENQALAIASNFLATDNVSLLGTDTSTGLRSTDNAGLPAYYIFTNEGGGFVIVSASETAYPILGYSNTGTINPKNLPDGLRFMLDTYSGNINQARREGITPSEKMQRLRDHLKLRATTPAGDVIVQPLLADIAWDQSPYYNALAPNPQVPIGCVATATSQILRYWKYPERAIGHHQYTSPIFGLISFDFNHTFDWSNMPAATLEKPNEDIAILCYGVAVAIDMNFNYGYNGGSGAVHNDVPPALYRHYGYPKSVTNVRRSNYDDATWTSMVKKELDSGRPVQYGGTGDGGGHSFVLDGYDSTDLFHVNWGWGGTSNGWFKLNALDPSELGTGGGSGGFNKNQDMIINFAPPARINGDNNDAVADDSEDASNKILDNGVTYVDVFVFNALDFFIRYTNFKGTVTTSGGKGYSTYFTKDISTTAGGKLEYDVELNINESSVKPQLAIYIDYDDNGVFDDSEASTEKVFGSAADQFNTSAKGTYIVPADAKKGLHRMRVIATNLYHRNPNKSIPNGEIEDYYVTIK